MLHAHEQLNHINRYKSFTNLPIVFLVFQNLITTKKFNNVSFLPLIKFYDFIQVLKSAREFYTKN
jgi:hypothetical protein